MKLRVAVYAGLMLVTGTVNTVSTKFQDKSVVGHQPDGTEILFLHPAFQSACMFLGEALCLIPYFILRWRRRRIKAAQGIISKPSMPTSFYVKRTFMFAIPTLCDATGTTLLNIGLFYTFASTYQMLRGTLVLFTGFFTILILKRHLYLHHWLGMVLITAGAAIVGAASMLAPACPDPQAHASPLPPTDDPTRQLLEGFGAPEPAAVSGSGMRGSVLSGAMGLHWPGMFVSAGWPQQTHEGSEGWGYTHGHEQLCSGKLPPAAAKALFGNAMVVAAQAFTAFQFILEEKFLSKYRMQPLLAVGIEGAWGVVLCSACLPLLNHVRTSDGLPLDDAWAAWRAMVEVPSLRYAVIGSIVSIGAFNFFGLSVTQALSGASRATIDACRTLLVWAFSILAAWEPFRQLQVVGFVVLLSGTSLYNELLRSCLPGVGRMRPSITSIGDDSEGEGDEEEAEEEDPVALAAAMAAQQWRQGAGDAGGKRGGASQNARDGYVDAEAGGLQEPLLAGAGGRETRHSQSQRITAQSGAHQGRSAHHHHHTTMARSMRLGFNALSPHDLADEEEEDSEPEEDVADPMMLASTPYYGQSMGGLASYAAGLGASPGAESGYQPTNQGDDPAPDPSATAAEGATVPWAGLAATAAAAAAGAEGAAGASAAQPPPGAAAVGAAAAAPPAAGQQRGRQRGGFLAFMASQQQEQQRK